MKPVISKKAVQTGTYDSVDKFTSSDSYATVEARISSQDEQLVSGADISGHGGNVNVHRSRQNVRNHRNKSSQRKKKGRKNRRPKTMGRYPFVCAYRRYLKGVRARLSESTMVERERKLHFLAEIVRYLADKGTISTMNPSKFIEEDIIEMYMTLKQNGNACETLRKHISLLKFVTRNCGNRIIDDMLEKGKIIIGSDHREPTSFDKQELEKIIDVSCQIDSWKGIVCRFSAPMLTFLRLRPSELRTASIDDLDTKKWTFFIANPKGKDRYGKPQHMNIPDVLRLFVLEYLVKREEMLRTYGIDYAEPLIPAISSKGVNHYSQQAFGRLRMQVIEQSGIQFKWKDLRPTGGQLALDNGTPMEVVSRSMRHSSMAVTERYYCRFRADLANAQINETYNRIFSDEPAIIEKSVSIESEK